MWVRAATPALDVGDLAGLLRWQVERALVSGVVLVPVWAAWVGGESCPAGTARMSGRVSRADSAVGDAQARQEAFDVARVLLGVLLLAAAGLKAHQLATEPVAGHGVVGMRPVPIAAVEAELVLGLWLLSGLSRRLAWLGAVACFVAFAGVTLHRGLTGEVSCGCFGKLKVDPWYTLALDIAAVVALLMFRPRLANPHRVSNRGLRLAGLVAAVLGLGIPAGVAMASYRPALLLTDGEVSGEDRCVLLEPAGWVGQRFPLLKHIDIGEELSAGKWTVVLYHHDCPHCRKALPEYLSKARDLAQRNTLPHLALIQMPPYGELAAARDTICVGGKLSDSRNWFVETPAVVELADGKVVRAEERRMDAEVAAAGASQFAGMAPAAVVEVTRVEAEHDFGFVQPESKHCVVFDIANPSKGGFRIDKVSSECKCMVPVDPPRLLRAEAATRVRVGFAAPKERIRYNKRVLLVTSDPQRPTITLRVKAMVGLPLQVEPVPLDLGTAIPGEQREGKLTIVNHGDVSVRPIYATSSGAGCIALIPRALIPPGGRLSIPVVAKADGPSVGVRRATLTIQTDCASQPQVEASVCYTISAAGQQPSGGRPEGVDATR